MAERFQILKSFMLIFNLNFCFFGYWALFLVNSSLGRVWRSQVPAASAEPPEGRCGWRTFMAVWARGLRRLPFWMRTLSLGLAWEVGNARGLLLLATRMQAEQLGRRGVGCPRGHRPRGCAHTRNAASCAQREPLWALLLLQVCWHEVCLVGLCLCPQVLGVEIVVLTRCAYGWTAAVLLRGFKQCT